MQKRRFQPRGHRARGKARDRANPGTGGARRDSVDGGRPAGSDASGLGGLRPRAATASPLLRRNPSRRGPDLSGPGRYVSVPQHGCERREQARPKYRPPIITAGAGDVEDSGNLLRGRGNLGRREDRLDVAWLDGDVRRARPHLLAAEAVVRELHQIGMDLVLGVRDHLVAALRL